MRDRFVRVAAATPSVRVCDVNANTEEIVQWMREASGAGAKLLVLPELCLTGYSCGDMFLQTALIDQALKGLSIIARASAGLDLLTVIGMPLRAGGLLMDCAACVKDGRLLGVVPKRLLRRSGESGELRWFQPPAAELRSLNLLGEEVPFGDDLIFRCEDMPDFTLGVRFYGDHSASDACVVACPAAIREIVGSPEAARLYARAKSTELCCAHVLASAGVGESSTDMVFSGRNLIVEKGKILAESGPYATGLTMTELDVGFLSTRRAADRHSSLEKPARFVPFRVNVIELALSRRIEPLPFVPADEQLRAERCEQILNLQAQGLARRMRHAGCRKAVLGVSGGLDSTLAMLVAARTLRVLQLPPENLIAVTMPCFGTTARTKNNAALLSEILGATLREINIADSVTRHLRDIGHDLDTRDAAYENAQARERTQVLMDIANMVNAVVVGTGDLSELALGWATYNGDHMSMYGVNGGVPKTLMRHMLRHCAQQAEGQPIQGILMDILATPVSPELLPPVDGVISQMTEELVGPYELHDFFLYHLLRRLDPPRKIKRLAMAAFAGQYDEATVERWLQVFLSRFFSQQFKRSCLPDGPMVGSVTLSPRGGLVMPSDAVNGLLSAE